MKQMGVIGWMDGAGGCHCVDGCGRWVSLGG